MSANPSGDDLRFVSRFTRETLALILAAFADRVVRGATAYRTLLIWPYAVAPVLAGALWVFMFNPTLGVFPFLLDFVGVDWNHYLNGNQAMALVIFAAAWKQIAYNFLFYLAAMQSIPRSNWPRGTRSTNCQAKPTPIRIAPTSASRRNARS